MNSAASKIINEEGRCQDNNNAYDHDNYVTYVHVADCHDILCNKKYKLTKYYNSAINKTYIHLDINEEAANQEIIEEVIKEIIEEVILEECTNATLMNIMNILSRFNGDDASVMDDSASVIDDSASVMDDSASVMDDSASVMDDSASVMVLVNKKKGKKIKENKDEIHFKHKTLNFDKIKNIVKMNISNESNNEPNKKYIKNTKNTKNIKNIKNSKNTKNTKNISLDKQISLILRRVSTKIETELAKETMNYVNILKSSKKSNGNDNHLINNLSAIYHLILNKM